MLNTTQAADAQRTKLSDFRQAVYDLIPVEADALFELGDAVCYMPTIPSFIHLSTAPCFRRQFASAYKALARSHPDPTALLTLLAPTLPAPAAGAPIMVAGDHTTWPRVKALTVPERGVQHAPTAVPGNRPITFGFGLSTVGAIGSLLDPTITTSVFAPLLHERIPTHLTPVQMFADQMRRIQTALADAGHGDHEIVAMGDSEYGCAALFHALRTPTPTPEQVAALAKAKAAATAQRKAAAEARANGAAPGATAATAKTPATVTVIVTPPPTAPTTPLRPITVLARLAPHRVLYRAPQPPPGAPDRNRKHGTPFKLRDRTTWGEPEASATLDDPTLHQVHLERWRGLHFLQDAEQPFDVLCLTKLDADGNPRGTPPVWMLWTGATPLPLPQWWAWYGQRFTIEHWYRLLKQRLHGIAPQVSSPAQVDTWCWLMVVVSWYVVLAHALVDDYPCRWQKSQTVLTPGRILQGLPVLLSELGTPTHPPKLRGKPSGRPVGFHPAPRPVHLVKVKQPGKGKKHPGKQTKKSAAPPKQTSPPPH